LLRLPHEVAQHLAGLVGARAVQVDLSLQGPHASAQLAQHIRPDAGAAPGQRSVGLQEAVDIEFV